MVISSRPEVRRVTAAAARRHIITTTTTTPAAAAVPVAARTTTMATIITAAAAMAAILDCFTWVLVVSRSRSLVARTRQVVMATVSHPPPLPPIGVCPLARLPTPAACQSTHPPFFSYPRRICSFSTNVRTRFLVLTNQIAAFSCNVCASCRA